jgi:hypothetical protein
VTVAAATVVVVVAVVVTEGKSSFSSAFHQRNSRLPPRQSVAASRIMNDIALHDYFPTERKY